MDTSLFRSCKNRIKLTTIRKISMSISEKVNGWFSQSFESVKLAFGGGVGIVKKGWTILALAGALAAAGAYIVYVNHKSTQAEEELAQMQEKSEQLQQQTKELIELNAQNQQVYSQLQQDRERMDALVNNFNYQLQANAKALSSIGNKVSSLEDGKLAPVLRETVRQLQQLREARDEKK